MCDTASTMAASDILTPTQRRFLSRFYQESGPSEALYLSGGTALAAYYLEHRYSDDLDFFARDARAFRDINPRVIASVGDAGLDIVDVETGDHSVRYRLAGDTEQTHALQKVEFLFDPYPHMGQVQRFEDVLVDALLCIAIKKVDALHNRLEVKDYVDFYLTVNRERYLVNELIAIAKQKNGAIDEWMIAAHFDQIDSLVPLGDFGRLYMRVNIDLAGMVDFYKEWARRLFEVSKHR
jgi:predicted nucleotidyltransferase component of viral defense system